MFGHPRDPAERKKLSHESLRRATESGDAEGVMAARGWMILGELEQGDVVAARRDIDAYGAMIRQLRMPFRRWYPTLWRATLALLEGRLPLHHHVLCVSGRLSFELVQKAAVAGAPVLVGVGAPTSLAVELAADRGMTLAGFARRGSVNVYTRADRVIT